MILSVILVYERGPVLFDVGLVFFVPMLISILKSQEYKRVQIVIEACHGKSGREMSAIFLYNIIQIFIKAVIPVKITSIVISLDVLYHKGLCFRIDFF